MAQSDTLAPQSVRYAAAKPKMTVYFAMLIIAMLAMLIGCIVLWMEIKRFGGFGTVKGRVAAAKHMEQHTPVLASAGVMHQLPA